MSNDNWYVGLQLISNQGKVSFVSTNLRSFLHSGVFSEGLLTRKERGEKVKKNVEEKTQGRKRLEPSAAVPGRHNRLDVSRSDPSAASKESASSQALIKAKVRTDTVDGETHVLASQSCAYCVRV